MIDFKKTQEAFAYSPDDLSDMSGKDIYCICDYCNSSYISTKKRINIGRKVVAKDACIKCKFKKREDVSIARDGVKNSAQRPEVRKKISEKSVGFGEKFRDSMMKKYGTQHSMQIESVREKSKATLMERYGVDNPTKSDEIKERVKETCIKKFGSETFLGSEVGRKSISESVYNKYGVQNVFQSEDVKEKMKQTFIDKYGFDHPMKNPEISQKIAKSSLETRIKNGHVKIYDGKLVSDLAKESSYSKSRYRVLLKQYGLDQLQNMSPSISYLESILQNWLDENKVKYTTQFKVLGKKADFLLTDYNIILELDGLYWHSEFKKNNNYHQQKRQTYIDAGYFPLFFRENEINDSLPIIQSMINNKMGLSSRIFARQTKVVEGTKKQAKEFCQNNHIMGAGRGSPALFLYYNNEPVMLMQFCRDTGNDYEISRLCSKIGLSIVGGASKLFSFFINKYKPSKVKSFVDLRYGDGNHLNKLGFKEAGKPYLSFKWTDCHKVYNRMMFKGNTGYDHGLVKIFDCGQKKFVWEST